MWREFPDHPAVNLQKRCEISPFWSGFLRQPKHDSQHLLPAAAQEGEQERGTEGCATLLLSFGVGNTLATFAKPIAGDCELSSQERLPRFLGDQQKSST